MDNPLMGDSLTQKTELHICEVRIREVDANTFLYRERGVMVTHLPWEQESRFKSDAFYHTGIKWCRWYTKTEKDCTRHEFDSHYLHYRPDYLR